MKNLATPSSIFIFVFSSSTGELCSQPVRGNDRPIGRMFPEHVERSFLDPEYNFDEYFQLGSRRKVRPIKNRIYTQIKSQHRKLTIENKILPPLLPRLEPETFLSQALPLSHPCSPHLDPLPELFSFSARERSDGILFLQCL